MILLRPRALFRTQKRTRGLGLPVLKASRSERNSNIEARSRLVGLNQSILEAVFAGGRLDVDSELSAQRIAGRPLSLPVNSIELMEGATGDVLERAMLDAVDAGGDIGLRHTGVEGISLDGGLVTQRAREWVRSSGGERITSINRGNREAISDSVARALSAGGSPMRAQNRISRQIGLTGQQARSLENFEAGLLRQRIPSPEADTQFVRETISQDVERARERMIRERSRRILDTEMQTAIQEGERQFYEEAAAEGQVELELLEKRWFTVRDDRVCQICEPLHGRVVGFRDDFSSLGFNGPAPPAHPSCRCFLEYKPGGDFSDDESPAAPSRGAAEAIGIGVGVAGAVTGAALALGFFGQQPQLRPLARARPRVGRAPLRINLLPGSTAIAARRFGGH
jgi:hypothetical protein